MKDKTCEVCGKPIPRNRRSADHEKLRTCGHRRCIIGVIRFEKRKAWCRSNNLPEPEPPWANRDLAECESYREPTPDEIESMCAELRSHWTEARWRTYDARPWRAPHGNPTPMPGKKALT